MHEQKAKYIGDPRAVFNVGTLSFPYGIWIKCPAGALDMIKQAGTNIAGQFEFDPPLGLEKEITIAEIKPRSKKRRKTSKQEADE